MEELQNPNGVKEKILKGAKLNLYAFLLIAPLLLISVVPFAYLNGWQNTYFHIKTIITPVFILALLFGIVVHEALHAFTWMLLLRKGFKSIKFGFNLHSFSPYTHCTLPMKVWQYKLGGLTPGFLMGIIPILLSFVLSSVLLNFVGFLFLWAASGDIISLFMIRKLDKNSYVLDHPDEMGFILVDKDELNIETEE